jgi:hypothetical protein
MAILQHPRGGRRLLWARLGRSTVDLQKPPPDEPLCRPLGVGIVPASCPIWSAGAVVCWSKASPWGQSPAAFLPLSMLRNIKA